MAKRKKVVRNEEGERDDPVRYDPDYHPEHATKFCLLGATNADLARVFEVSENTVESWMWKHAEFKEAVHKGRELADADVAEALFKRAIGYKHKAVKIMQFQGEPVIVPYTEKFAPDVGAIQMWLTNRQSKKWKNKTSNEVTAPDGEAVTFERIERVIIDPKT